MPQILRWADAYYRKFGDWPMCASGRIAGSLGETWRAVETALVLGRRGFQGGSSLTRLLAEHRGKRNRARLPPYTKQQLLAWADAHRERTGKWPHRDSGPITEAPGESWHAVEIALVLGRRGFAGGSSLARFLAEHRGKRNHRALPRLNIRQILSWADAHFRQTGRWPMENSGPIQDAPGETWMGVDGALVMGCRGLSGGSSLPQLLAKQRGFRNIMDLPRLSVRKILCWADAFRDRTGRWPTNKSGWIDEAPGESWRSVDTALVHNRRGVPKFTLARLLAAKRGRRYQRELRPFSIKKILQWADAHHRRTGRWPIRQSGPIQEAPGETWSAVNTALVRGGRGLVGGSSLAQLLAKHRGVPNVRKLPHLTIPKILAWADAFHRRTGRWPTCKSGPIEGSRHDTWNAVASALFKGGRGLPGGSSLPRLLATERGVHH